jgi:hypothetical protein
MSGGQDATLSVWLTQSQEAFTEARPPPGLCACTLLILNRNPDAQFSICATRRELRQDTPWWGVLQL